MEYLIYAVCAFGVLYGSGLVPWVLNWFLDKKRKIDVVMTMMNNITTEVSQEKSLKTGFSVNNNDLSASVLYERMMNTYVVWLPYDRSQVAAMSQFKVELLRNKGDPVNITQQPGIPYLVSATELGGHSIKVINTENGTKYEYTGDQVPLYCKEVLDD